MSVGERARLAELIEEKLRDGVDGFLCVVEEEGTEMPVLIVNPGSPEISKVVVRSRRFPLAAVISRLQSEYPGKRFAVLVRGCDERALVELSKMERVDLERLEMVGLACSGEEAEKCACPRPYPTQVDLGERSEGTGGGGLPVEPEAVDPAERMRFWAEHFSRCIKCYGCRNICPMCFCKECALENPDLVEPGSIPPEFPSFHLVRAVDMAGRCIDCGLCEEACPAEIPLRGLYRRLLEVVEEKLGYRPGMDREARNPLGCLGEEKEVLPISREE